MSKLKKFIRTRVAPIFSSFSGMPLEAITNVPVLLIKGDCEAVIEGCTGILEYSEKTIRLETNGGILCILGEKMTVCDFRQTYMTVKGQIFVLQWEKEEHGV